MQERIREILIKEKMTSAQFADLIGVQRSSISHILSGRNKPGFDFIQKIIMHFPEIDAEWLITGKGTVYRKKNNPDALFVSENYEKTKGTGEDDSGNNRLPTHDADKLNGSPVQEEKKIERILVFYSDKTFREYQPEG